MLFRSVELRRNERPMVLQQTATGAAAPARALDLLDAMRWLDRLGYHTWCICHYLGREDQSEPVQAAADVPLDD